MIYVDLYQIILYTTVFFFFIGHSWARKIAASHGDRSWRRLLPARSVIPQTDISSIDGQKSWSGLTRVNWINAFLPTMRRPFTGNNMKICRIKSAWRSSIGGSRRAFKQRPLGLRGYWGGLGPMLYLHLALLKSRAEISCAIFSSLKTNSCRDILWTVYQIQSLPDLWFFVSVACCAPYIAITWWPSLIVIPHRRPANLGSQAVEPLD